MVRQLQYPQIDGFLTFLLEGGADKRCSNVYRIITQLRDERDELRKELNRRFMADGSGGGR